MFHDATRPEPVVVCPTCGHTLSRDSKDNGRTEDPYWDAFLREDAAFQKMFPQLRTNHDGAYVAVFNEELVDHDADEFTLVRRIRETYPGRFVLVRRVDEGPTTTVGFESPE